jgi:predicted Zn-dependent peptidase
MDKHFHVLADILSDIFLNSGFDTDNLMRERQVILQEISMVEDSPEEHIHELFNNLFWTDHPLGMSILGTAETVAAIDRETMIEHLRSHYTPTKIIIAATGNVDHDEVVNFFKPLFKTLAREETVLKVNSPHIHSGVSCFYKDLEQVHICLGGKAPHLSSDQRFAGAILNTILGGNMSSKLFQEVREKRGLAYSIYSFLSSYLDAGLLGICAGIDSQEVNNVLDIINNEIRKIQNGDISNNDLNSAREHLVGGVILSSESTDTRMMRLAKNEYVFGRYIEYEELMDCLARVTIDEVVTCMREAFSPGNVSLATLGPLEKEALRIKESLFEDVF